jgi:flagellar M-ring protein FliF
MDFVRSLWGGWSKGRRLAFVVGLLLIAAVVVGLSWWTTRARYGVLFTELKQVDAAEIAGALDGLQVPHRFADDGATVLVPEESVYDARMKLVAQGVPHGGSVGFEVFKDSDFGVTEFAQRVNYQRALQGELERTIASIPEVQAARVHLTMRRAGMFESQDSPSKASVSLTLQPGRTLAPRQVVGIQRLVASAVDGLSPDAVTVLGQGGAVLSGGLASDAGEEQARVEGRLRQRIEVLLREALGESASFAVSVSAQLNYDRVKQVKDMLLPQGHDGNGLLVRQKTSNARATPGQEGEATRTATNVGESELEYAHGRQQEEVEIAPGRIQRLSIGILVPSSLDAATITKLTSVIGAAAGLDAQRGDRLDIAAVDAPAKVAAAVPADGQRVARPAPPAPAAYSMPAGKQWLLAGLLGLLCFGTGAGIARLRAPRRLPAAERERLLQDVRRWIDTPERP